MAETTPSTVEKDPIVKVWLKFIGCMLLTLPYYFALEALRPENIESLADLAHGVHLLGKAIAITVFAFCFVRILTSPEFRLHVKLYEEGYALARAKRHEKANRAAEPEAECSQTH